MAITHKQIVITMNYIYVFYVEFSSATFNLNKLFSKYSYKKVICYFFFKNAIFVTNNEVL